MKPDFTNTIHTLTSSNLPSENNQTEKLKKKDKDTLFWIFSSSN